MKANITCCLIICLLAGCTQISFKDPQPRGEKSLALVPETLRGKYLLTDKTDPVKDTIIIEARGFRIGYFDAEEREKNKNEGLYRGGLGDSVVLKTYKHLYFFSFNESPEWVIRVVRPEKNGDLTYMTMEPQNISFAAYLKKLSAEIQIDSSEVNGSKLYQIDPSPKQLMRLIKKGYFTKATLQKVQ
jgi:hypothetical protein